MFIGAPGRGQFGIGQMHEAVGFDSHDLRPVGLAQFGSLQLDEARAEALKAGEILVARGLIDPPLHAEIGRQGLDRDAAGLD